MKSSITIGRIAYKGSVVNHIASTRDEGINRVDVVKSPLEVEIKGIELSAESTVNEYVTLVKEATQEVTKAMKFQVEAQKEMINRLG